MRRDCELAEQPQPVIKPRRRRWRNLAAGVWGTFFGLLAMWSFFGSPNEPIRNHQGTKTRNVATNLDCGDSSPLSVSAPTFGVRRLDAALDAATPPALFRHLGRHPTQYHQFVLRAMEDAAKKAGKSQKTFLKLFEDNVKSIVRNNPQLLRKIG